MSESDLIYDWRFTANQFALAPTAWVPRPVFFFFQINTCGYSTCAASSLTRGWVCRLQLLALASTVIIRSELSGTLNQVLISQIRDSPKPGGSGPRIYFPQEHGGPVIPPDTGMVPFSSPPMTPRGTVEVFEPAATRSYSLTWRCQSKSSHFTTKGLPPISSSWFQAPRVHDQIFFQLSPCGNSPYVTSSLTRRWGLSLMNMLGLSSSVYLAHTACYWKFILLNYTQVLCQHRLCKADHAYVKYLMLQRRSTVYSNGSKLDHP
jgi:hypothetical protein